VYNYRMRVSRIRNRRQNMKIDVDRYFLLCLLLHLVSLARGALNPCGNII
jgi:hypothetical protein